MAGIPFWLQNVIGNSARAGLIAAGSPTPGAVGTIRDAVGGLQAAEADQQQRQDRMTMMRRAALQEQRAIEQMEMEREQNEAMLEYRRAQKASEEAQRDRALSQQKAPDGYIEFRKRALAEGITDEDQIMSAWMKQPYRSGSKPQAPSEPKTPQQIAAQRIAQISRYQDEPELDPTGDREKEDWAFLDRIQNIGKPPAQAASERPFKGADGRMYVMRGGKAEALETGKPAVKPPDSGKPRYRVDTRKDGQRVRVNLDTGEVTELGYEEKARGNSSGGSSSVIEQFLGGDAPAAPSSQPPKEALSSLKEGVVTTFANGQKWTLRGGKPTQVK